MHTKKRLAVTTAQKNRKTWRATGMKKPLVHTIRVSLRSEGDGLFDVDFGSWKQRGWTIHPMDRHGVQYEARKTIQLPPQDDGQRVAA